VQEMPRAPVSRAAYAVSCGDTAQLAGDAVNCEQSNVVRRHLGWRGLSVWRLVSLAWGDSPVPTEWHAAAGQCMVGPTPDAQYRRQ
jgi:hypothetical protein